MRIWRASGLADPIQWFGSLPWTCWRMCQPPQIWPLVAPLLSDSVFGVRVRAASLLAAVPTDRQPPADRERLIRPRLSLSPRSGSTPIVRKTVRHLQILCATRSPADAEAEYKAALRLSPQYTVAAINLADLYRQLNRDGDGEALARGYHCCAGRRRAALRSRSDAQSLKRVDESLVELGRAAELDPNNARYPYVYAVGLHSAGRVGDAIAILKNNLEKHPEDRDSLLALVTFNRDSGNIASALDYAERLAQSPGRPAAFRIGRRSQRQLKPAPNRREAVAFPFRGQTCDIKAL